MLLALDPGLMTGYAVFESANVLKECGTLNVPEVAPTLKDLQRRYQITIVVVERLPSVPLSTVLHPILQVLSDIAVEFQTVPIHRVGPGEWKPVMSKYTRNDLPNLKVVTQHEFDACLLGLFFYQHRMKGGQ